MNIKFLTTDDGVRLGYIDKGSGIPVILMAGYSAPAISWYREEKTLLKNGYRVIAFDRRPMEVLRTHLLGRIWRRRAGILMRCSDICK